MAEYINLPGWNRPVYYYEDDTRSNNIAITPLPTKEPDNISKINSLLEQFSGELAHIDPIPTRIEKADFDLEEEKSSFSISIPVEEIGDILFLKELLSIDPLSPPEIESSNLIILMIRHLLSSSPEPPDVEEGNNPHNATSAAKWLTRGCPDPMTTAFRLRQPPLTGVRGGQAVIRSGQAVGDDGPATVRLR
ncbi:hypothetical protein Tco_1292379 [Tanacetum coccineum]